MGIFLSIPIGIIYNLSISKLGQIITKDSIYKEKIEKNLIIEIIGGIIALIFAFGIFGNNRFENNIVKYGLIFGGVILLFYSVISNWDTIEDITKLFALITIMSFMIIYSYKYISKSKSKLKLKIKKNKYIKP
jgi:hypothetical protein